MRVTIVDLDHTHQGLLQQFVLDACRVRMQSSLGNLRVPPARQESILGIMSRPVIQRLHVMRAMVFSQRPAR